MFGSIFEEFEAFNVTLELYIEDKVVNRQSMQAPKQILIMNFLQTAEQIGKDNRPMKLRMCRPEVVWTRDNKEKILNNEVSFSNNAMMAWEKDRNGDNK